MLKNKILMSLVVGVLGLSGCNQTYQVGDDFVRVRPEERRVSTERVPAPVVRNRKKYVVLMGDCKPSFSKREGIYVSGGVLWFNVSDLKGENNGLSKIVLYEESSDRPIKLKEFDGEGKYYFEGMYHLSLSSPKKGRHTYFAEAIDIGGNKTISEKIDVDFVADE